MRRGQVSFEVITAVGLMLVFFAAISLDAYFKNKQAAELKTLMHAREVVGVFTDSAESVATAGDGFYRYFSLPRTLSGGHEYNITAEGGFIDLVWGGSGVADALTAGNVTIHCLNYSRSAVNRIANNRGVLEVTCSMPDLSTLAERITVKNGVLYATIVNNAPVPSPAFTVTLNGTLDEQVTGLGAEEAVVWEYNVSSIPSGVEVKLIVDSNNEVIESIEENNEFTVRMP